LIIEALHQFHLDVPLVIIGKPTIYMNELLTIIQKYNMEKQVIFVHDVETVDLPAIYTMAEIFIYPSIFEGFGIPVLEALCSGTPVIASKGSCFEETGGLYSKYISPSDAEELGYTISQILSDTEMKNCMRKEGLIFSERFTDDKIANQLMKVYKSI